MSTTADIEKVLKFFDSKFYQLLLIAGCNLHKKSLLLKQLVEDGGYFYINLNLVLAQRLMVIPAHERSLVVSQYIDEIVHDINSEKILFDHIEILFEKPLKINPIALLKNLSRYRKLIVIWPGEINDDTLIYAKPGHPEYAKYLIEVDFTAINLDQIEL